MMETIDITKEERDLLLKEVSTRMSSIINACLLSGIRADIVTGTAMMFCGASLLTQCGTPELVDKAYKAIQVGTGIKSN